MSNGRATEKQRTKNNKMHRMSRRSEQIEFSFRKEQTKKNMATKKERERKGEKKRENGWWRKSILTNRLANALCVVSFTAHAKDEVWRWPMNQSIFIKMKTSNFLCTLVLSLSAFVSLFLLLRCTSTRWCRLWWQFYRLFNFTPKQFCSICVLCKNVCDTSLLQVIKTNVEMS